MGRVLSCPLPARKQRVAERLRLVCPWTQTAEKRSLVLAARNGIPRPDGLERLNESLLFPLFPTLLLLA